jgi:hypothetical protein
MTRLTPTKLLDNLFCSASVLILSTGLLSTVLACSASASILVNIYPSGNDVLAVGSGSANLAGLSFLAPGVANVGVQPNSGYLFIGSGGVDAYSGITGPAGFGPSGAFTIASSASGDKMGIFNSLGRMGFPLGYISGSPLSGSATFANHTLASLGLTEGSYVYTWGAGANADSFTISVSSVAVPEPSTLFVGGITTAMLGATVSLRRPLSDRRLSCG